MSYSSINKKGKNILFGSGSGKAKDLSLYGLLILHVIVFVKWAVEYGL
jgi:hypothetical protein